MYRTSHNMYFGSDSRSRTILVMVYSVTVRAIFWGCQLVWYSYLWSFTTPPSLGGGPADCLLVGLGDKLGIHLKMIYQLLK